MYPARSANSIRQVGLVGSEARCLALFRRQHSASGAALIPAQTTHRVTSSIVNSAVSSSNSSRSCWVTSRGTSGASPLPDAGSLTSSSGGKDLEIVPLGFAIVGLIVGPGASAGLTGGLPTFVLGLILFSNCTPGGVGVIGVGPCVQGFGPGGGTTLGLGSSPRTKIGACLLKLGVCRTEGPLGLLLSVRRIVSGTESALFLAAGTGRSTPHGGIPGGLGNQFAAFGLGARAAAGAVLALFWPW